MISNISQVIGWRIWRIRSLYYFIHSMFTPSFCAFMYLTVYLSIYVFIYLIVSIYLSIHLSKLFSGIYDQFSFPLKQETSTPASDLVVERKGSVTSLSKEGAASSSSRAILDHTPLDGGGAGGGGGGVSASSRGLGEETSLDGGGSGLGSSGQGRGGGSKGVASTGTAEDKAFSFAASEGEKIFEEGDDDESKEIQG